MTDDPAFTFSVPGDGHNGCVPGTFVSVDSACPVWADPWERQNMKLEMPLFRSRIGEIFLVIAVVGNNTGHSWFFVSGSSKSGWISFACMMTYFRILVTP